MDKVSSITLSLLQKIIIGVIMVLGAIVGFFLKRTIDSMDRLSEVESKHGDSIIEAVSEVKNLKEQFKEQGQMLRDNQNIIRDNQTVIKDNQVLIMNRLEINLNKGRK